LALQQGIFGYVGCEDAYIYEYDPDNPDDFWWDAQLKVGNRQRYASLVRFELGGLPANTVITQATLQLYASGWTGTDLTIGAYYITRTTTIHEATWNRARIGERWALPGGNDTSLDRSPTPEGIFTTRGVSTWYGFNVTSAVQGWISHGLANNGLLVRASSSTASGTFSFASAQSSQVDLRPKLVVTYRLGPTPTPPSVSTLIIGQVTDSHIGAGINNAERLRSAILAINTEAQVLVDSGDCTEHGTEQEMIDYANTVNGNAIIPWRALAGNHDALWAFERYVGPLQWSLDLAGYRLIGINALSIDYSALDMALTTEKPCVVVGHFPLSWLPPADQILLQQRFRTYRVLLYISGHTHIANTETDPESGTILLTGPSSEQGHYQLITLRGSTVESIRFK
jgi:hypothetical protein